MLYNFWKNHPPLSRFLTKNENNMTITFKTTNIEGNITLGEDANVEDCVDAFVGAMIAEGYDASSIADAMENKSKYLDKSTDKYC